jgi:hypothetical protein
MTKRNLEETYAITCKFLEYESLKTAIPPKGK